MLPRVEFAEADRAMRGNFTTVSEHDIIDTSAYRNIETKFHQIFKKRDQVIKRETTKSVMDYDFRQKLSSGNPISS